MASTEHVESIPPVEIEKSEELSKPRSASPETCDGKAFPPKAQPAENRLRPAGDVISRLIWDVKFERNDFIIGFVDRFEGQLEVSLGSWKKDLTDEEFIPQHRILYIRHVDGEVVWDRRRRIDKIFHSGNSAFSELAFLTG